MSRPTGPDYPLTEFMEKVCWEACGRDIGEKRHTRPWASAQREWSAVRCSPLGQTHQRAIITRVAPGVPLRSYPTAGALDSPVLHHRHRWCSAGNHPTRQRPCGPHHDRKVERQGLSADVRQERLRSGTGRIQESLTSQGGRSWWRGDRVPCPDHQTLTELSVRGHSKETVAPAWAP